MRRRKGFTLIEVSLFLAITGLLFMGITLGVQNSIYNQRYNDSVQSFADFLRNVYSETLNVQSIGGGNSEQAIYGKLITFGEKTNSAGGSNSEKAIYVYDVIGKADSDTGTGSAKELMKDLNASVVVKNSSGKYEPVGVIEEYVPKWGAEIQKADGKNYKGSILIVRHPRSGTVYTYATSDKVIEVNDAIKTSISGVEKLLTNSLDSFSEKVVDFCVAAAGEGVNNLRRDIRIVKYARNASGVEVVGSDTLPENVCAKK